QGEQVAVSALTQPGEHLVPADRAAGEPDPGRDHPHRLLFGAAGGGVPGEPERAGGRLAVGGRGEVPDPEHALAGDGEEEVPADLGGLLGEDALERAEGRAVLPGEGEVAERAPHGTALARGEAEVGGEPGGERDLLTLEVLGGDVDPEPPV